MACLHDSQEEGSCQTADGTEYEIQTGGKGCLVECPSQTLHENFRSSGIGAYINAYMAHDANKGNQYNRLTQ